MKDEGLDREKGDRHLADSEPVPFGIGGGRWAAKGCAAEQGLLDRRAAEAIGRAGWTGACQYDLVVPHVWGERAQIDRRKALGGKGLMGLVGPDSQGKRRGEILARNGFLGWDASGCGVGT